MRLRVRAFFDSANSLPQNAPYRASCPKKKQAVPGETACLFQRERLPTQDLHQVQLIRPFAEELQVFVVNAWLATAVHPAGGPAIAVAVTVTRADAVNP